MVQGVEDSVGSISVHALEGDLIRSCMLARPFPSLKLTRYGPMPASSEISHAQRLQHGDSRTNISIEFGFLINTKSGPKSA